MWAGQRVMPVPHLTSLVVSVTRHRVRVHQPGSTVRSTLVRRRELSPALLLPSLPERGTLVWLSEVADRRGAAIPVDLRTALDDVGLSISELPERERRHLVSMVREATDPAVRQERIDGILAFLDARVSDTAEMTRGNA
jgi:hypothetical protein